MQSGIWLFEMIPFEGYGISIERNDLIKKAFLIFGFIFSNIRRCLAVVSSVLKSDYSIKMIQ